MAVKIRLKRLGKIRAPYYRIVVVDARAKRDGRVIEEIGKYHPTEDPSFIEVDSERVQYWLSVGAQPTDPVLAQLKLTGDWQKFKGLPYEEGRLKVPARQAAQAAAQAAALEAAEAEALRKVTAQAEEKARAAKKAAEEAAKAAAEAADAAGDAEGTDEAEAAADAGAAEAAPAAPADAPAAAGEDAAA
ncbi:MAG: 30S ribosomal protein S16 [Bifidobacteriaceae bacterium]|nr:30S ribosomal protein S16 [Bifidobacteriaceae bacterium]